MTAPALTPSELAPSFSGQLLQPADASYDEVRRVHFFFFLNEACLVFLVPVLGALRRPPARPRWPARNRQVRHLVIFKYKAGATPAQIAQVTAALRQRSRPRFPGITAFEDGVNNSPEGKNLGFTHAYLLTFEGAAARDAYLPHPEHKKFGELLGTLG